MKQSDDLGLFSALIAASAASGNVATVPDTQTTAGDGSASIALGFPPETFIDRAAGGSPPRGADMNGFLNRLSRAIQVLQAGYVGPFNSTFAQAIGGYPAGAIVSGSTPGSFWVSTADSNVTTPGASGATWKSLFDGYLTAAIAANTYVKRSGDTMSGILNNSSWVAGGVGGGWNNNSPAVGEIVFTNGIEFGNPADNGDFRGTWSVTDVHGNGAADQSGLNLTGYDSTGTVYQWYFAWNGNIRTPKGSVAFQSDLDGYLKNANGGIGGEQSGTSLVYQISAGRAFFSYNNNGAGGNLAWYSDVTAEATSRTNADNNLQAQISAKMDGSFAAFGLFDGSQGSTTSGTIVGGTWMRVGNTLTQNLVIENIGGGTVTFPFAFSGNNNQVTVIVQDGTGSNNSYTTGSITTTSTGIHASGGGGTGRLHLTVSGPYGT